MAGEQGTALMDSSRADDGLVVEGSIQLADQLHYYIEWDIEKWSAAAVDEARALLGGIEPEAADFRRLGIAPSEVGKVKKNLVTTAGLTRLVSLLNGAGGTALTTTTCRCGVGNGAGTAVVGDTDLSASAGSTNRWFNLTTVSISGAVVTVTSSFASGDGNFAWNEFGLDIGTATVTASAVVNACLFNHKTSIAQGTKASGQVWAVTATITES